MVSIAPAVLVGGLGYLLLNDITADAWLSAIVSVLAALLVAIMSLLALSRLQGKGAFRVE